MGSTPKYYIWKNPKEGKNQTCIWKKGSILFDLMYLSDLDVRHCIDVMHVEKNVCDSVIGMLFNIQGKTKDGLNTCQDLAEPWPYETFCLTKSGLP